MNCDLFGLNIRGEWLSGEGLKMSGDIVALATSPDALGKRVALLDPNGDSISPEEFMGKDHPVFCTEVGENVTFLIRDFRLLEDVLVLGCRSIQDLDLPKNISLALNEYRWPMSEEILVIENKHGIALIKPSQAVDYDFVKHCIAEDL